MPKYRLGAACGWIAGSETEFGTYEYDTEEEAQEDAWSAAAERIEAWAKLVEEDEATPKGSE